MTPAERKQPHGQAGYAMITVVVFVLVVIIAGMAFFAMSSYETKGALYRQNSSEAFYLADAAVERARAKFLEDRSWRDGWTAQEAGRGEYDLTVTDTTYMGHNDAVQLLATGRVEQAERRIEVMAKVPPTAFGLGILIMGDADVNGNICIEGSVHVVGDADFGPHDVHLVCGEYTSGFEIVPPPIYTDPDHFPDATYYYVKGNKIGNVVHARIFDGDGVDITTALGDSLTGVVSFDVSRSSFNYQFDRTVEMNHYFDDATGIFKRNPGDIAVVVNFGEPPLINPPGLEGVSKIEFKGAGVPVHATIINTRFIGVTDEQRVDPDFWKGGLTTVKQIVMEPYYGIALITYDFQKTGGSLVVIGTETWPALVYVTQDVEEVNANFDLVGAITVLGDWNSTGGPNLTYDEGFLENLPGYLLEEWPDGVSGTLRVLHWREVAAGGS